MRESDDLYEILQLHPSAEPEVIQAAYRRLAQKYHPDVNKSPDAEEIMRRLNRAYETLSNPSARRNYNARRSNPTYQESRGNEPGSQSEDP